jgi:hypothetical protein
MVVASGGDDICLIGAISRSLLLRRGCQSCRLACNALNALRTSHHVFVFEVLGTSEAEQKYTQWSNVNTFDKVDGQAPKAVLSHRKCILPCGICTRRMPV